MKRRTFLGGMIASLFGGAISVPAASAATPKFGASTTYSAVTVDAAGRITSTAPILAGDFTIEWWDKAHIPSRYMDMTVDSTYHFYCIVRKDGVERHYVDLKEVPRGTLIAPIKVAL